MMSFQNMQDLQRMEWQAPQCLALVRNELSSAPALVSQAKNEIHKKQLDNGESVFFVEILSDIGGFFGVRASDIAQALVQIPPNAKIHVLLNSAGGSYFEGLSIANLLFLLRDRVTIHLLGIAASAASLIAFCGARLLIHKNAKILIHEGQMHTNGGIAEHKKAIKALEMLNSDLLEFFAARFPNAEKKQLEKMLSAETILGAQELRALGATFETSETNDITPPQISGGQNRALLDLQNVAQQKAAAKMYADAWQKAQNQDFALGSLEAKAAALASIF